MKKSEKNYFFSRDRALPTINDWRQNSLILGFTSGAFDLLHYGHVNYLNKAAQLCDRLLVGVNSDRSIRGYKGIKRPLVEERDRVRTVAALRGVGCAFIFDELNNRENINILKPRYYFKGGDYRTKNLSSASYLKNWGGEVKIIPFIKNHSTSGMIDKILERYHDKLPRVIALPSGQRKLRPAIFLDRDGVINEEVEYLHDPVDFTLISGAMVGLKHFQKLGYRLVVVTNQAGIGLGYFTKADFFRVNKKMLNLCHKNNVTISGIYYCPHSLEDACACRKPGTLLLERAATEVGINLSQSIMIGDKTSDIACGKKMGLTTISVKTGHGGKDGEYSVTPDVVVKDLRQAAKWVDGNKRWLKRK